MEEDGSGGGGRRPAVEIPSAESCIFPGSRGQLVSKPLAANTKVEQQQLEI
jgi:hypothetical protein